MSTELRDTLELGAGQPGSTADVQVAWTRGRKLRRRRTLRRGTGAVLAACIVVAGVYSVVGTGNDERAGRLSVATDGADPAAADFAFSMAMPAGWTQTSQSLSPGLTAPARIFVASTFDAPASGTFARGCAILPPAEALSKMRSVDALVWVFETAASGGGVPRPAHLDDAAGSELPCGGGPVAPGIRARWIPFTESGRDIYAVVAVGGDASSERQAQAYALLNSIQFDGTPPTVTLPPTGPPATTLPPAATTTPPASTVPAANLPPADAPTDARIRKAVLGWLGTPTADLAPYVEDFASIRDVELQGAAQHSAAELAAYSGQVDSVTLTSPTTADVQYTLLNGGHVVFSSLSGRVVEINGQWMVSRETVCDLLTRGGLQCPPRSR
ncbi:MAG: hypothetical protein JWL73_3001 [Actinomycetia bacterium]|nr:hypothetical protein [Actinomycetes bacterium]